MMADKQKASPLSVGTFISMITAVLFGGMYIGGLDTDVQVIQAAMAQDDRREAKDLAADRETDKKLERIEVTQDAIVEDIGEIKKSQEKQGDKLDRILEELRNR